MKGLSVRWWAGKIRQTAGHLAARVHASERADLERWLTPAQLDLFDRMHVADRRHGLDVVATLRREGITERDVLVAGLLHDAGKGDTGIVPRIAHSLGEAFGPWVTTLAGRVLGIEPALERLRTHAETSAELALAAGCSKRTAELIRWQEEPRDPEYGERLRLADEAN
jgi:hypothetical protein